MGDYESSAQAHQIDPWGTPGVIPVEAVVDPTTGPITDDPDLEVSVRSDSGGNLPANATIDTYAAFYHETDLIIADPVAAGPTRAKRKKNVPVVVDAADPKKGKTGKHKLEVVRKDEKGFLIVFAVGQAENGDLVASQPKIYKVP